MDRWRPPSIGNTCGVRAMDIREEYEVRIMQLEVKVSEFVLENDVLDAQGLVRLGVGREGAVRAETPEEGKFVSM